MLKRETVDFLSREALISLARWHIQIAAQLIARAQALDDACCDAAMYHDRVRRARRSPDLVAVYKAAGQSHDQAIDTAARLTGLPLETIHHFWRSQANRRRETAGKLRDKGLSDREIGEAIGLSPKYINDLTRWHRG